MESKSLIEALSPFLAPFGKVLVFLIAVGCIVALLMGVGLIPNVVMDSFYDKTDRRNEVAVTVLDAEMRCRSKVPASRSPVHDFVMGQCEKNYPTKVTFIPESRRMFRAISNHKDIVFAPGNAFQLKGNDRAWAFVGPGNTVIYIDKKSKQVVSSFIHNPA